MPHVEEPRMRKFMLGQSKCKLWLVCIRKKDMLPGPYSHSIVATFTDAYNITQKVSLV